MAFVRVANAFVLLQLSLFLCTSVAVHGKQVAVQGVVYCKSCNFRGEHTLVGATPLSGAVVKLQCNITEEGLVDQKGETDRNGYFFISTAKLTASGTHECKVFLVSSPLATCSVPTDLHNGTTGAVLKQPPLVAPLDPLFPFELFTVGPFAFEHPTDFPC